MTDVGVVIVKVGVHRHACARSLAVRSSGVVEVAFQNFIARTERDALGLTVESSGIALQGFHAPDEVHAVA